MLSRFFLILHPTNILSFGKKRTTSDRQRNIAIVTDEYVHACWCRYTCCIYA